MSKIAAGGFSAGVFLLWWPGHFPAEGLEWLVLRGLLWTLTFEMLLLAFGPLETMALRPLGERLSARNPVHGRLSTAPASARAGGAVALACFGAAIPVALLADSGTLPLSDAGKPKVVERVVVERPVVKRVVVREAAPAVAPERTAPSPERRSTTTQAASPIAAATRTGGERKTPRSTTKSRAPERQPATPTGSATLPAGDAPPTTSQPAEQPTEDASADANAPAAQQQP